MKHVLITAGGTGGHVFPALAVADELKASGWQVSWLGTADRIEARVVPAAGYHFIGVAQEGLRGKGLLGWLFAPFRLVRSVFRMRGHLKALQPDVVLGFGGYTAGPAGLAAWSKSIPLIIHEQNAVAGLTNRLLARFAGKVLLGFVDAAQQLPKSELVGNPVREAISALAAQPVRSPTSPFQVLIVGGSLGAQHLNEVMPEVVSGWQGPALAITHQTGAGKQEKVALAYGGRENVTVTEFIDDMAAAYATADLVICRAGALTCSELACAGVASILVPYPHAVDNHQLMNAKSLSQAGGALVIEQTNFVTSEVHRVLLNLVTEPKQVEAMAVNARSVAAADAAKRVALICNEHVAKRGQK
ncbi:undecaprenyldiphospho-muramoylpentapeptide beta-N-acetylglucosaminyltransferase [Aliidiomarina celeris]|uniref:undecaprenyldiphospho-muramoylpentapeptide beta-N-acetylglucosaminyltransferase n=1 Tax=Aliidiomarina celeris TaxID=2249428 RepID=UPI000DE9D1BB|nr:undecaprenyldiphospho-muramoylpentapeptide beta-N-acetylglucosaminyltransferase [Aliidiomarina celeris]